jgi:hypothetical protein
MPISLHHFNQQCFLLAQRESASRQKTVIAEIKDGIYRSALMIAGK